jgi:hypothetical protein
MPADDLREQFDVKVLSPTDADVRLQFKPKLTPDQSGLDYAVLVLHSADYIPKALVEVDVGGTVRVHVFRNVSVMTAKAGEPLSLPKGSERLERPDLSGYSLFRP